MADETPQSNDPSAQPNPPAKPHDPNLERMLHVSGPDDVESPPPKKKRRWPRVLGVLLLIVILLIVCAPYIASMGFVRSIVVGQINKNINGLVSIDDYSVGWTGGIDAKGVKVADAEGKPIVSISRVSTKLSLLGAIRGKLDLGDTHIAIKLDNIVVDENGNTNLADLTTTQAEKNAPHKKREGEKSGPIDVPDVKGKITIDIEGGSISGPGVPETITIDPSTIALNITSIDEPILDDIKLQYRTGSAAQPSSVSVSGAVSAVQNRKIDPETIDRTIKAQQKIALSNVNLSAAAPFLKKQDPDAVIGGIANGSLDVNVEGVTGISAAGEFDVADARFSGAGLSDMLVLKQIAIPIHVTRTVVSPNETRITIDKLAVNTDLASVNITGDLTTEMLDRLQNHESPGAIGKLAIDVSVPNLGAVATALPKTLQLAEGVSVTSGSLSSTQTLTFTKDSIASDQHLKLAAEGTGKQGKIRISPIDMQTSATAFPNGKPLPAMKDIKLALTSGFINVNGGGADLGKLDVKGNFDLAKLRDEAAQFTDLSKTQLSGNGELRLTTTGDPSQSNSPVAAALNVTATDVHVGGENMQSINQPRIALATGGNIKRDEAGAPASIDGGTLTFQAGDASKPLIDVNAAAQVDLVKKSVPSFELVKFAIENLAEAQQQFGGLVPALKDQQIRVDSGAVYAQMKGSFDGKTIVLDEKKPLGFSVPNLRISKSNKLVMDREDITGTIAGNLGVGDTTSAHLSALEIKSKSDLFSFAKAGEAPIDVMLAGGGVKGTAAIAINANVKRLSDIARAFANPEGTKPVGGAEIGELTSGKFAGTLNLAHIDAKGTAITFDGKATELSMTTSGKPLSNETVAISAKATSPDDLSGVNIENASIDSRFATAKVSDGSLKLGAGIWELVQKLNVDVNVPDLPAVDAVMKAFNPPAVSMIPAALISEPKYLDMLQDQPAQNQPAPKKAKKPRSGEVKVDYATAPLAPLDITSGSATMKLAVSRDPAKKTTTNIALTDFKISNLAMKRDQQSYAFTKDVTLSLKASIDAATAPNRSVTQQINNIKVDELSGDLGVAKLSMPAPIQASGLGDAQNLVANGAVKIEGKIDDLTPLLAVISGNPPLPYSASYQTTQAISTRSGGGNGVLVSLKGETAVTDFVVNDNGKQVFSEKKINIRNDVDAYPSLKTAIARDVSLDMPETQAVAIEFRNAYLRDWDTRRIITGEKKTDPAVLTLGYDIAKIWPIVKPTLSPSMQDSLKDAKLEGKYQKTFNVSGSYPQMATWQESLRYVSADGSFALQLFDGMGLNIQTFDYVVALKGGVLTTKNANKPAICNGGTMDLGGMTVDLRGPEPRISIEKNKALLKNVTINPLLGDTLGKFINPMFANNQRAKGLLNVTMNYCETLALGDKLKTADSGKAQIAMSIKDMDIANPMGSLILGGILEKVPGLGGNNFTQSQADSFKGELKDAVATIDAGTTKTSGTFLLIDPTTAAPKSSIKPVQPTLMPMTFDGTIRLSDLKQAINLSMPSELVAKFIPDDKYKKLVISAFPAGIPIVLKGTSDHPQPDYGDIGKKFIEGQIKNPSNIGDIGDILGGIGKKKKSKGK